MADFRRWFYAFAVVALLAGLTVPASAQVTPFVCNTNAGVPPIVRAEAYADLVGDLTLNCTGGSPTVAGQVIPQVNITIFLSTNITSRLLGTAAGAFNEALLIIDEPNAVGPNSNRPILNCGNTGAPDNGPSGPGVCQITSVNGNTTGTGCSVAVPCTPANTYDGTLGTTAFGTGRPNVFQGRQGIQQNAGQSNIVTFLGVPLDPPGTGTTRTLRITNVRADAEFVGVASTFQQLPIQMQISVNGNTSLSINNPTQVVAYIQRGLITSVRNPRLDFVQCNTENGRLFTGAAAFAYNQTPFGGVNGGGNNSGTGSPIVRFQEGFASSWKEKNIAQHVTLANNVGNGTFVNNAWLFNGGIKHPPDLNQNVPGAIYNTETGFEYNPFVANPNPNPPNGIGNGVVTGATNTGYAFNSASGTGISGAGIATQGTRLALAFSNIPSGSGVWVPPVIFLFGQGVTTPTPATLSTVTTGVAVLTSTDAAGNTAYSPAEAGLPNPLTLTGTSPGTLVQVSNNLAVYEVLFDDPFRLEQVDVPVVVAFVSNLSANPPGGLPVTGVIAQVAGGFAPFYTTAAARQPSATLPVPRFVPGNTPVNIYAINKCACDMLFPFTPSVNGFDTGIAIANTSLDPGATYGFFATPQQGTVTFWYYGTGANGAAPPASQTSALVPAGQVLTYVLSNGGGAIGNGPNGLDNRAAGFSGYIIAQAQFQYCHSYAFISALGGGPTSNGVSEGYLGLILDPGGLVRTFQAAETLVH